MARKPYSPIASYAKLKEVEKALQNAQTADDIRNLTRKYGADIGYKAFCYLLTGKMTPEAMKPDEAAILAFEYEQQGEREAAREIYRRILEVHPNHPLAKSRLS
ncbi:hypothetical protein ARMA_0483 [Ardenticatena maritima]|uniref:Uncharacterized protein n=1 Tax=Ardenticatena maritima TaxID=872965 RepID=A0A0M9UBP2_9CHLR|nr:tetratricopeptide repeat protein [Ardenticatena maritima]KPL87843.1 hypothetical protein SE16_09840 [Ardenticatena maritima]GAP62060.1 hypothetical protein ARMA_0483 [Ardenticatena maritima]